MVDVDFQTMLASIHCFSLVWGNFLKKWKFLVLWVLLGTDKCGLWYNSKPSEVAAVAAWCCYFQGPKRFPFGSKAKTELPETAQPLKNPRFDMYVLNWMGSLPEWGWQLFVSTWNVLSQKELVDISKYNFLRIDLLVGIVTLVCCQWVFVRIVDWSSKTTLNY